MFYWGKSQEKNRKRMLSDILAQRSVGCLGQVTKAFGHFFRVATDSKSTLAKL